MDRATGVQIHPIQALHKAGTVKKFDKETDLQNKWIQNWDLCE